LKTIFSKLQNHVPNDKPQVKCMMRCKGKVVGEKVILLIKRLRKHQLIEAKEVQKILQ
jgi:hypothetical protein